MAKSTKMVRVPRDVALQVLLDVDIRDAYVNLALNTHLNRSQMSGRDRAFVTELVYGVVRWRGTLDWIISRAARRPIESIDAIPRNLLRLGAYQGTFLRSVPGPVACHETVEQAKRRIPKAQGFINAVCRAIVNRPWQEDLPPVSEQPVRHLAAATSHPEWIVERWIDRFGVEQAYALCAAGNVVPPVSIRTNTLRTSREALLAGLAEQGLNVRPSVWLPEGILLQNAGSVEQLPGYKDGMFVVQDEAAGLVGHVLSPRPGQIVFDMCAAPGGKTTHIAQLMGDVGQVIAIEEHQGKARLITEAARRLGMNSIQTICGDARKLPEMLPHQADCVLLDAPCSGLGLLRKKPDIRWRRQPSDIRDLVVLQRELLEAAVTAVKPGGTLVYSTCTIEPEENEEQIQWCLERHPEFRSEPAWSTLSSDVSARLTSNAPPSTQGDPWLLLYPHIHGTDGFFIARLRRRMVDA